MPDYPPSAFEEIFSDPTQPTIIGGQAINLWAQLYSERAPELAAFAPFLSKDGDLWADRRTVVALRDRTGWSCQFYDEPRTHAVALLTKTIPGESQPLRIEVLKDVYGLTPDDLTKSSILELAGGKRFRLLEPAPLIKGKLATLDAFKAEERPNDVRHLKLLVPITHEFFVDRIALQTAGSITDQELIASLRYAALNVTRPAARSLSKKHGFEFSKIFPSELAASSNGRIRNFAIKELQRTLWPAWRDHGIRPDYLVDDAGFST